MVSPNVWKIEIVIPLLDERERDQLFDKVVSVVMDWAPENRDWDPELSAHAQYDNLYDDRSYKFNVGQHVRILTDDDMNDAKGIIVNIEPGVSGCLPYEVDILTSEGEIFRGVPFEEYELAAD